MKRNRKGKREGPTGRKAKPSNLGTSTSPKRSKKQKIKPTAGRSKKRLQLSSGGKSLHKATKSGRSLSRRASSLTRKGNRSAVEYLAGHWESMPRPERIRRLRSLIDHGWKIRALARDLKVVSESRIRQLLKSATTAKSQTASIPVKPKSRTGSPHALPQPQNHEVPESPDRADQSPSPSDISSSPGMQPATKPAAPDYALRDPEIGGQLVAGWIRSNFKSRDWSDAIADYTTASWFNRPSVRQEAERANNIPAGLRPLEVIRYFRSDAIKAELEGGFFQGAMRKWFVCWASILLPDPLMRRKAVERAGQILDRPAARWSYLTYDPHLNQPTSCIRSQGTPLADFLEKLTKYVDFRSLLINGGRGKLRSKKLSDMLQPPCGKVALPPWIESVPIVL